MIYPHETHDSPPYVNPYMLAGDGGCDGDGSCGDGQSGSVGCGH